MTRADHHDSFHPSPLTEATAREADGRWTLVFVRDFAHPLIPRWQAFLAENDIAVAGIEFIVDENGRSFTYDVNTNTNYNPDAEAKDGRAGTSASGMGAIASYLGGLLARETRAGVRQAAPVPA